MHRQPLVYLLALAAMCLAIEQTKPLAHLQTTNNERDDIEVMQFEASGNTKRDKKPSKPDKDDKPKTLSQQIADGKYGLIQNELFTKPHKRPGILSYESNDEVPNDNGDNLGGLDKNEIWLAENHLLVLRGGKYPPYDKNNADTPWPPLDNYKAPLHQVKIPKRPKVPPPFPVQLTEDGPLQILGTNYTRTLNETDISTGNALPSAFHTPSDTNSSDTAPWPTPVQVSRKPSGEYPQGEPFPPQPLNGTWPPYLGYLPPGAVILPPPGNQTDELYDYDDPSIYYPPPYSFYYPKDNSSVVPPGPLVPGIVLPPPPNFFAPLEDTTTTTSTSTTTSTTTRKPQRYRKPTIKPLPTTTESPETTTRETVKIYPMVPDYYSNEIKPAVPTTTKAPSRTTTVPPSRPDYRYLPIPQKPRRPSVTKLRPVPPPKVYINENEIPVDRFRPYVPQIPNKLPIVTSTQVPLKYYTTSNHVDGTSDRYSSTRRGKSRPTPAQFYYYEEQDKKIETTPRAPNLGEEYYVRSLTTVRQRKPQYVYVTARPYNTQKPRFRFIQRPVKSDTFSFHIAKLQQHIDQYYTTPRPAPKPVYQFSYQAANYQPPRNVYPQDADEQSQFRPVPPPPKYSVEIQQAVEITPTNQPPSYKNNPRPIFYQQEYRPSTEPTSGYYTTSRPQYQYEEVSQRAKYLQDAITPRPISEYSYEATQNPIFRGFYTKPDEGYFDDRTKKYFTMFGRKLPVATTPLPRVVEEVTPADRYRYEQKPISLEGDTLVNYVNPRPSLNPDAELIPVRNPPPRPRYPNVVRYSPRPLEAVSKDNTEIVRAVPVDVESSKSQDGSFVSYQLPGDEGAHFYFLTPQFARDGDQSGSFYYSRSQQRSRIRRNEKNIDKAR